MLRLNEDRAQPTVPICSGCGEDPAVAPRKQNSKGVVGFLAVLETTCYPTYPLFTQSVSGQRLPKAGPDFDRLNLDDALLLGLSLVHQANSQEEPHTLRCEMH
jgi:hypothetical protein